MQTLNDLQKQLLQPTDATKTLLQPAVFTSGTQLNPLTQPTFV